jgi:hypothetical protein
MGHDAALMLGLGWLDFHSLDVWAFRRLCHAFPFSQNRSGLHGELVES